MEQPGCCYLVTGLTAHGETTDSFLFLNYLCGADDVVVSFRNRQAEFLKNVLAIGQD